MRRQQVPPHGVQDARAQVAGALGDAEVGQRHVLAVAEVVVAVDGEEDVDEGEVECGCYESGEEDELESLVSVVRFPERVGEGIYFEDV